MSNQPIPTLRESGESGETLTECAERLGVPFWKAMEIARTVLEIGGGK